MATVCQICLISTTFLGCALLASCNTSTTTASPTQNSGYDPEKIRQGTRVACEFLPTLASVLSIIGTPGAPQANEIVKLICVGANKERSALQETPVQQPGEEAEESGPVIVRPGTPLKFEVLGKQITGVTAPPQT